MRTFVGASTLVLLGLSPWILPSLAVAAAKMVRDEAHTACGGERVQSRLGDLENHGGGRAGHRQAMQDCVVAKLSQTWPWR
jgi:hypothetical protein